MSADAISIMSALFAMAAGGVMYAIACDCLPMAWFLAAAVFIQLRLICNLMDGMVAIEGGKKSLLGGLYNEVPDRFADLFILVPIGIHVEVQPLGIHLGWLAGALAVFTAYIRLQGASLTGVHEFCGPMAKPQRMAMATLICVVLAIFPEFVSWLGWALVVIVLGEVMTLWRRLVKIANHLRRQ